MTESAAAKALAEFHGALGQEYGSVNPADEVAVDFRRELHREEHLELREALIELPTDRPFVNSDDLAHVAQELADVVYVAYGTAYLLGIPLDAVLAEIHRANMSKLINGRPVLREDGKVLKPEGWKPADVGAVLARQAADEYTYFTDSIERRYLWRYKAGEEFGEISDVDHPTWDDALSPRSQWSTRHQLTVDDLPAWVSIDE